MSDIVKGAEEALAVARGEQPAARIHINGHAYVPQAEVEKLRAALREIVDTPVYGFAITDLTDPDHGDIFVEGTNRFVRERDFKTVRKIARAALGGGDEP